MTEVEQLLREYIAEHRGGGKADPLEYVQRLEGADRKELAALIDGYLERAPRQEWDRQAYESSRAPQVVDALARSLEGQAGLWPSLLPRLRARARMKRDDLVAELAARLGATEQREKVGAYYHQMEQGTLPPRACPTGCSRRSGRSSGGARMRCARPARPSKARPPTRWRGTGGGVCPNHGAPGGGGGCRTHRPREPAPGVGRGRPIVQRRLSAVSLRFPRRPPPHDDFPRPDTALPLRAALRRPAAGRCAHPSLSR